MSIRIAALVAAAAVVPCCGAQQSLAEANRLAETNRHAVMTTAAPIAASAGAVVEPPATIAEALQQMAASASRIFVGTVRSVTEQAGGAAVEFAVEEALLGVDAGGSYRIRVSAWGGGVERYHAGQRALFLLHAPSAAGYTSPVEGGRGIVPLEGDAWTGTVDLRWVAAGVLRSASARSADDAVSAMAAASADAVGMTATGAAVVSTGAEPESAASPAVRDAAPRVQGNVTGVDVHAIDRDLVTGLLRTWQASGAGAAR